MENNNQYSSDSNNNNETSYSSKDSVNYTSEAESQMSTKEDMQKYQISKPRRIIIKARLIND
jgi:hypothetical protein